MNKGTFKKGNTPWNKGVKGLRLSPATEFKSDGSNTGDKHPSWGGGLQHNKRDGIIVWTGTNRRKPLSRKLYEDEYGKIPDGYIIYHIDGDKLNNDIDNLEAISRAELIKRNLINRR